MWVPEVWLYFVSKLLPIKVSQNTGAGGSSGAAEAGGSGFWVTSGDDRD